MQKWVFSKACTILVAEIHKINDKLTYIREVTFDFYNTLGKQVKSEKRAVEKGINRVEFEVYELGQDVHFIIPSTTKGHNVPTKFVKM